MTGDGCEARGVEIVELTLEPERFKQLAVPLEIGQRGSLLELGHATGI